MVVIVAKFKRFQVSESYGSLCIISTLTNCIVSRFMIIIMVWLMERYDFPTCWFSQLSGIGVFNK